MTAEYSHPFKDPAAKPLPKIDATQQQLVDELFEWCSQQPKFPSFSLTHAHQFLHACLWDAKAARKSLQKYCSIRASSNNLFGLRDPMLPSMQTVLDVAQMVALPKQTPEGYHILVYRLIDSEPSRLQFSDAVKAFCMFNDYRISCDGLVEGYIVVFDMRGIRLGHVARVQLGAMRTFMAYIQDAHPVRLKKVYVVHTASFINQIMALVKPFLRSELSSLLHFTVHGPLDVLTADLLPSDYDGELESIDSLYGPERKCIESEYRHWLIDSAELRERSGKERAGEGADTTSFGALEID